MTPFQVVLIALASLFLSLMAGLAQPTGSVQGLLAPDARLSAAPDTVVAGETYITNLPDSLSERAVSRYKGIALPARSWLIEQSFFWKTGVNDRGTHDIWFRAFLENETTDSVMVRVTIK